MTEDEMAGWHHRLNGHAFEQTLGDGEGQGSPVCCSPWGHKEPDMTERMDNKEGMKGSRHMSHRSTYKEHTEKQSCYS